jgi:TatD DNase family protein
MSFVDTHCHLDVLADPDEAVAAAAAAGVTRLICMGLDAGSTRGVVELAHRHAGVFAGAGHHPTSDEPPDLAALRELAGDLKVVAVGEVGLDFGHPERAPEAEQVQRLHALCELAIELDLPLSIHNRDAESELLEVLRAHPGIRGVMHYWALDWDWARRFLELGLYLSFSGLATRASREAVRAVAKAMPADRLLLETDSPFGMPRGRPNGPNQPAWLVDVAEIVAGVRGMRLEELAELEERNARALFTRLV